MFLKLVTWLKENGKRIGEISIVTKQNWGRKVEQNRQQKTLQKAGNKKVKKNSYKNPEKISL